MSLTNPWVRSIIANVDGYRAVVLAEVAELADALRSGRSEGNLVWVQVPLSAPTR